jgi:hypothetical protein
VPQVILGSIDFVTRRLMKNLPFHSNPRQWFSRAPLHPFLLAVYPILGLLAVNISEIGPQDALTPILIALSATAVIFLVFRLLVRNWQAAGILTSLLVLWIFVYGHLYNLLKNFNILGVNVGRHRYLLVLWSGLILVVAIWLLKESRRLASITMPLNIICMLLVFVPITQISMYQIRELSYSQSAPNASGTALISWNDDSPPPDIYYIVLDGYGRSDAIQQLYGIDNSAFIASLQRLGFYVAQCSQSNYTRTALSLSSTFNLQYIQDLDPQFMQYQDYSWLYPYLKHSLVRQQLEQLGYQTIVFKNPWENMIWDDADIVYQSSGMGYLSPFEYLLLDTTILRVYLDTEQAQINQIANYTNYNDTVYALEKLQDVPEISGPKFVFAHIVVPHMPFVFGPDGEYIYIPQYDTVNHLYTDENYERGYTYAVTYIDKRMLEIIPQLIQSSKTPPIIILAGDHGTGDSATVTMNLEALYAPEAQASFYATLTPVNIFRLLFNTYFNGSFALLPDHGYLSVGGQHFNFQEVPSRCDLP